PLFPYTTLFRSVDQLAFDIDAGNGGGGAFASQREQLVGEQVFQALAATCEEFHVRAPPAVGRTRRRWPARAGTGDGRRRPSAAARGGWPPRRARRRAGTGRRPSRG